MLKIFLFFENRTSQEQKKLAAINGDNHEDLPRNNQARNTNFPRIQEDNFAQVSE